MNFERTRSRSEYLHWAKTVPPARFNLATSGIAGLPLNELPFDGDDWELSPPGGYGYQPLQERLAEKCNVSPENVVAATGASMANFLAMAAVLEPGDEVLIEHPTYEPLLAVARHLGAEIRRFPRLFENDFAVVSEALRKEVSKRTRLIVLTNFHNPSGVQIPEETICEMGDIARTVDARVLVDEVYLEMGFDSRAKSAFYFGDEFIVTTSLTKAYGLSGLRCGWVLAAPELARRMWRLGDLYNNIPPHVAERLSVAALDSFQTITARAKAILGRNRPLLDAFLDGRPDLEVVRPASGTIVFPRLARGDGQNFVKFLREKYDVAVVPGDFFEMPQHFRIGIGGDTEMLRAGLERLAQALDAFSRNGTP
jgi:aspartate/methionine/tyrosine aminotransferase